MDALLFSYQHTSLPVNTSVYNYLKRFNLPDFPVSLRGDKKNGNNIFIQTPNHPFVPRDGKSKRAGQRLVGKGITKAIKTHVLDNMQTTGQCQ